MTRIFAYGTLRDPEFQRALFDRELALVPARLEGWMTVIAPGGYFTIVPAAGEAVNGDVLIADGALLAIADAWEEVPLYERIRIDVQPAVGASINAWVYVRATDLREPPAAGSLSQHPREHVLATIAAFRATNG